jgi:hypothetical protein
MTFPLKEDDTYLVLNKRGFAEGGAEGFYRHDTRFLARYRLALPRAWNSCKADPLGPTTWYRTGPGSGGRTGSST